MNLKKFSTDTMKLSVLMLVLSTLVPSIMSYFADWSMLTRDSRQPTCVDIPNNMTLCHNIGKISILFLYLGKIC